MNGNQVEDFDFYKTTKCDLVLVALVIALSCVSILWVSRGHGQQHSSSRSALVYHGEQLLEEINLGKDGIVALSAVGMRVEVGGTKVRVVQSDCPHQVCVDIGWVEYPGQTIVCVPNKILIEMESSGPQFLDAVVY